MAMPITPMVPLPVPPSIYLEARAPYAQGQPQPGGSYSHPWVAPHTVLPAQRPPPDYVLLSLFNTMFLNSFCFGFLALIYSIKSRDCKVVHDLEGAARYGKTARLFNIVAAVLGLVIFLVTVVLAAVVANNTVKKWNSIQWSVNKINSSGNN